MSLEKIYSALKTKNIEEGIAFLVTSESHLIELHLYGNIITNIKSRHMPAVQIAGQLNSLTLKDTNISAAPVRLAQAQPDIIMATFMPSAPFALNADMWSPARRVRVIRLLAHLQAEASGAGTKAAVLIAAEITRRYPDFSLNRHTIEKRVSSFAEEFRFPLAFLASSSLPDDELATPAWVVAAMKDLPQLLETILVNDLIFGTTLHKLFEGKVKRENTLETKRGCVRISRIMYPLAATTGFVSLFRGKQLVGSFHITPLDDRRLDIHIADEDASSASLGDGDPLHLIFAR
jgi:hypothetical protein